VGVTGDGLVNRVVDDLVDQVVEATLVGRANVHPRAPADSLKPLKNLNATCVVLWCCWLLGHETNSFIIWRSPAATAGQHAWPGRPLDRRNKSFRRRSCRSKQTHCRWSRSSCRGVGPSVAP